MLEPRLCISKILRLLIVLTLAHAILSQSAFAKKEPKTYPEVGKVIGVGTTKSAARKGAAFTRTYKIETAMKIYELDCGKSPIFARVGGECGGEKKLHLGDEIHFRTQKEWVYIPITEKGTDTVEQRLRIISEDLKPGPRLQDDTRP